MPGDRRQGAATKAKSEKGSTEGLKARIGKETREFLAGVKPPAPRQEEQSLVEAAHEALAKLARWDIQEEEGESVRLELGRLV